MTTSSTNDTIIALSSGQGRSGVAVLRLSGSGSCDVLRFLSKQDPPKIRVAATRWLIDQNGDRFDEALVFRFEAPNSFTGEDVVEIQCHGSPAVISTIIELTIGSGLARLAEPGEFSRRAFENGKLDLLQAEGIADLIESNSAAQMKQAAKFLAGDASDVLISWRKTLLQASAFLAASLDFSDEGDVSDDVHLPAQNLIDDLITNFETSLRDADRASRVRDGLRIAILGKPNAGKSTLINYLTSRETAIVSEIPGTTRDIVESQIQLAGVPVTLADTAGLRETDDFVEAEGVRRAESWAASADLIIFLSRADDQSNIKRPDNLRDNDLWVVSQVDRMADGRAFNSDVDLQISVQSGDGLESLVKMMSERVRSMISLQEDPVIVRARHKANLETALDALKQARVQLSDFGDVDLAEFELSVARSALDQILGRVEVEDILGEVFSGFCVGK